MPHSFRLLAALLIGASGFFVMLSMGGLNWAYDWPFLLAATIGAAGSGYFCAEFFGHTGQKGIGAFLLGACIATLAGAALAGFGLGLIIEMTPAGAILGPMVVGHALVSSPPVLVVWLASMTLAQVLLALTRPKPLLPS